MRFTSQTLSILGALAGGKDAWSYGYELSKRTGLKSGTLYPILARLHDEGWVETKWTESQEHGRPPRHLYRLTAMGMREARRAASLSAARTGSIGAAVEV